MNKKIILVVEDEAPIREMLQFILQQANFKVLLAEDAKQAYQILNSTKPHLVLLDWMLPGISGIEITKHLRDDQKLAEIPVVILTARATEENKIKGLEIGADDYIVKPFSPRELIARIKAVLRRGPAAAETIQIDDLIIETTTQRVLLTKQEIPMGRREYELLVFLASHPNHVFSRTQLLDRVWGRDYDIDERSVDACVRRLRKLLQSKRSLIETVRSAGYRLNGSNRDQN